MGGWWSYFFSNPPPSRILILGLDNAGKTTLLTKLKLGEVTHTTPTVGFNVESVQYKSVSFFMWDVGGQDQIRMLWRHYYDQTEAVIWVIDSSDRSRLKEAKDELDKVLSEERLQRTPLLVYANKQDQPGAMTVAEVIQALNISSMVTRQTHVEGAIATQGTGLHAGLEWLIVALKKK